MFLLDFFLNVLKLKIKNWKKNSTHLKTSQTSRFLCSRTIVKADERPRYLYRWTLACAGGISSHPTYAHRWGNIASCHQLLGEGYSSQLGVFNFDPSKITRELKRGALLSQMHTGWGKGGGRGEGKALTPSGNLWKFVKVKLKKN